MATPALETGPRTDAEQGNAPVGAACFAAGLLVAQLVAAKATRDGFFLSNFPVKDLPIAAGLTAGLSLAGVLAFSRAMARWSPPVTMRWVLATSATKHDHGRTTGMHWFRLRSPRMR